MLNKEICKRCINERHKVYKWNGTDEEKWERGIVICSCVISDINIIPEDCIKYMEQVVLED